jgi:membrane-associated phospholipid phosphatase
MKRQPIWRNLVVSVALSFASSATSDVVTDWNTAALTAIRESETAPPPASRTLAILHTSIYDAVNGIIRTHEPYFVEERGPTNASEEAAASAAAHKVLTTLLPTMASTFGQLHETILAGIRDNARKRRGIEWGESVAKRILDWRANDGSGASVDPPGDDQLDPGEWRPTPRPPPLQPLPYAFPQWGFVTPFAIPSGSFFRPNGPPALDSARYAADYNEVKALGAATSTMRTQLTRTPEQTEIAKFWADGAGTVTPPGHWNVIAQDVAPPRNDINNMRQNARLFALLNVALADAAIAAWDAKYTYNFWRPVTAIREGESDGNSATEPDPEWLPLLATPPFADYTSGHSTFSGAAAAVLSLFYRRPNVPFTTTSDGLPGVERSFRGFLQAAREAALSRMYGGIHFRSANEDGLVAGLAIGTWTFKETMRRR